MGENTRIIHLSTQCSNAVTHSNLKIKLMAYGKTSGTRTKPKYRLGTWKLHVVTCSL